MEGRGALVDTTVAAPSSSCATAFPSTGMPGAALGRENVYFDGHQVDAGDASGPASAVITTDTDTDTFTAATTRDVGARGGSDGGFYSALHQNAGCQGSAAPPTPTPTPGNDNHRSYNNFADL